MPRMKGVELLWRIGPRNMPMNGMMASSPMYLMVAPTCVPVHPVTRRPCKARAVAASEQVAQAKVARRQQERRHAKGAAAGKTRLRDAGEDVEPSPPDPARLRPGSARRALPRPTPCPEKPWAMRMFGAQPPELRRAMAGDVDQTAPGEIGPRTGELRKRPRAPRASIASASRRGCGTEE